MIFWSLQSTTHSSNHTQTHKKKGLLFVTASLQVPALECKRAQEKRSSVCTEDISFFRSLLTRRHECRQTPPAQQGAERRRCVLSHQWGNNLFFSRKTYLLHGEEETNSLVQTIAFEISECNLIHSLKFCFLIWFINDMRQKLSSCAYKVDSAPRNPNLIWDTGHK